MKPRFLTLEDVLFLHDDRIARYGGTLGIRDVGLLQSALGMPSATFSGALLHEGMPHMAAAYLFHIAKNHSFLDGNKRTALAAAIASGAPASAIVTLFLAHHGAGFLLDATHGAVGLAHVFEKCFKI